MLKDNHQRRERHNILIVEDDKVLAALIVRLLKKLDYQVDAVNDEGEARKYIRENKTDLIILDYFLNNGTAKDLIEELLTEGIRLPFIIMTGQGDEKIAVEMMKLGAKDYIVKDQVFLDLLPSVVERVLTETAREEELVVINQALIDSEQLLTDIIDFLPDPTFAINLQGEVIVWNYAIEKMTGVPKENILGKGDYIYSEPFYKIKRPILIDYIHSNNLEEVKYYEHLERQGDILYAETFSPYVFQGRGAFLWIVAAPLYNNKGELIGAIESIRDMTDRKKMEAELQFLSFYDFLTKLYNRSFFEQEMYRLEDGRYDPVGVMVCDLDGLKMVNDTLGHDAGDRLLVAAADLIKGCFRKGDMVARVGGDEFAILLPNCSMEILEQKYRAIKKAVKDYAEEYPEMPLNISIGYTLKRGCLKSLQAAFKVADDNMYREKMLSGRSYRNKIVDALMLALESRDFLTEGHALRLQKWVVELATKAGLPEERIIDLLLWAQFHDIGKVGIPDNILFKPGPLTLEEKEIMERHSEIGYRIASTIPELVPIADWILKHHEWWNGSGYPFGLKGEKIPLECRILAIADAYDAMTNDRPYRKALSEEEAVAELKQYAGIQFDPFLVRHFLEILGK